MWAVNDLITHLHLISNVKKMLTESASSFKQISFVRQRLDKNWVSKCYVLNSFRSRPYLSLSLFSLFLSLSTLYLSFCFSSISLSIFLHFLSLCSPLYLSFMPSYLFLFCLANTLLLSLSLTCSLPISFSQPTIYYLSYHNNSVIIISFIFRST